MTGQGSPTFFEKLYDDTYLPTARYVARHCSDSARIPDILQDVYTDVYETLRRRGEGYIRQPAAFVLQVAKAKLARFYDRRGRQPVLLSLDAETEEGGELDRLELWDAGALSPEDAAVNAALLEQIMALVHAEPPETQRIFTLYYGFGLSAREIAGELGGRDAAVRSRLYRLTQKIRTELRKDGTTV